MPIAALKPLCDCQALTPAVIDEAELKSSAAS
jgi:hypothetical protein